jgi:hypothetical protein
MHESTPLTEFRLIDDGERLAIHRVAIDDAGAVVAWDSEPVRLEVPSNIAGDSGVAAATLALWRISSMAFGAANCTYVMVPRLRLIDGKLIDMPTHGGDDAAPVRTPKDLIAA